MSLRIRLALSVGVLVAAAIALSGWIVVRGAERELTDEVDAFLVERADRLSDPTLLRDQLRRQPTRAERVRVGRQFADALSEDDAATQLIDPDGDVVLSGAVELPVSSEDVGVAQGFARRTGIRSVDISGTRFRVITVGLRPLGAVMVGRDMAEVDGALDGLRRRTVVLGVAGAAVAALVAWLLATRLSRPIDRLTTAAEHVARTQDLSSSIEVSGGSEVARLATSFNTMLEALDTSREQQRRLVMDASHELRTPLTSVRTNIDLLRRAPNLADQDRDEVLEDLHLEVDELTGLVAELVDLATSSRRPSDPIEAVDLGEVARTIADRAARRHDGAVTVDLVEPAEVRGHRALIERAAGNLVDNAVKFAGGDISVRVRGARFEVADRGPGIDDGDKARVWDRFYRSDLTRSKPGSGLGLAIVKDVVTSHGGTVFATERDDGPGAVVGFELPLDNRPA